MNKTGNRNFYIVIKNITKLCRICLKESKDMISIYNNENIFQKSVIEMMNICMSVKVEEHNHLPNLVCETCRDEIIQATKLRLKFNKSHLLLIEHLLSLDTNCIDEDQIIINSIKGNDEQLINEILHSHDKLILKEHMEEEIISENCSVKVEDEEEIKVKKAYQYKTCGEIFNNKIDKLRHEKNFSHYVKKTVDCKKRNLQVPAHVYKPHYVKHSVEFKCHLCSKTFYNNFNLQRHIRTHTKQTPYLCRVCNLKFGRQDQLKAHMLLHSSGEVICKFCEKHFPSQAYLQKHFYEDNNCESKKYQRFLSCDICSKKFTLLSSLNTHKLLHTNESVICGYCGNPYPNEKKLQTHILQVHQKSENKQFLCNICAKQYSSKLTLDNHLLSHKGLTKRYTCKICQKSFTQSSSLILHQIIHTGDKPYICHVCSAAFNKSSNLYRHLNCHSDVFLHSCSICEKRFRTKQSLTIHIRIHTGEKPFSCLKCDKKFSDSSSLSKHSKIHE